MTTEPAAAKPRPSRSRSTARSRSHKKTPRATSTTNPASEFAYGSNEGDHRAADRIATAYLATHRGPADARNRDAIYAFMAWSESRCTWPKTEEIATTQKAKADTSTPAGEQTDKPRARAAGATSGGSR